MSCFQGFRRRRANRSTATTAGTLWLLALVLLVFRSALISAHGGEIDLSTTNAAVSGSLSNEPQPYMRIANPDSNTVRLEIAVRKFVPVGGAGPTVWLTGTSHIGDPEYYHAVQKLLDAQTVVLFEGVNSDAHPRKVPKPGMAATPPSASSNTAAFHAARAKDGGTNGGYSMQAELAKSLGLVFQLDAIDYDRTNFLNSDLSVFDIQKLMLNDPDAEPAAPGEAGRSSPTFDALLQIMDGSSFIGSIFKWVVKYIGTDPQLQATTKFMFVEMLGGMTGDMAEMRGVPPDMQHLLKVLIEARNQNVLDDLKTEISLVPKNGSIAVFYGTGHMPDLEKRVVQDLNYRPDGDVWYTAFSVDMRKTGLSPVQIEWMQKLIKVQLEQMKP